MPDPQALTPADAQPASSPTGKIILAAVFAIAIGAFFYFDLAQYLSLQNLKGNRDRLLAYVENHYATAVLLFIGVYCLQTALSLPGAAALTIAGGFLFGSVVGTLYVNVAATAGATLAFLAARYLLQDWVERKFGDRLEPIQQGFARRDRHPAGQLRVCLRRPATRNNLFTEGDRLAPGAPGVHPAGPAGASADSVPQNEKGDGAGSVPLKQRITCSAVACSAGRV